MFEHMKNYQALFKKVSTWLRPKANALLSDIQAEGLLPKNENDEEVCKSLLFIHIFCHKSMPYHFVEDDGWMAKNFFSGVKFYAVYRKHAYLTSR